jgi:hypothetical protein
MKVASTIRRKTLRPLQVGLTAAVLCLALMFAAAASGGADTARPASAAYFETQIAPLLAKHCLTCHDPGSKNGGLDLSRKEGALAGGNSGKAIVPGKALESLVWKHVESGRMPPKDWPRLAPEEQRALRDWIDAGATWSGSAIDPRAHLRDRGDTSNWVRRLTADEYIETVRAAVGVDIEREARRILPRDLRADGFTNTAYNLHVDLAHVEAYAHLAQIIVGRMDVPAFAAEYTSGKDLSEPNMRRLVTQMGKWLLRGPLEAHEVETFLNVSRTVAEEGGDFAEAAQYLVEAMLQSPRFIFRMEKQAGDGKPRRLSNHELASRLSYAIWGGPPDKELMRAADSGQLSNRRRLEAQVRRMLDDPRAVTRSTQFIREWLNLDGLGNLRPNRERFPTWSEQLAVDMREETLAYFRHVVWDERRPLWDLMNAPVTFVTPRLAAHYGLPHSFTAGDRKGVLALYTFDEGSGNTVRDASGAGEPLNLRIEDASSVQWEPGGLAVSGPTLIATPEPPKRLTQAIKKSRAFTLESWVTPATRRQSGPARIVTLSSGIGGRNFTLGQDSDRYEVRFRGSTTDANGTPSLGSAFDSVRTQPTHIVYTRGADGTARIFLNGQERSSHEVPGDLKNWDEGFRLVLGNETSKDRAWKGTLHLVAIYDRALAPEEISALSNAVTRYDLSSVPGRGGLLTHGSVLTVGGDEASMVARGLFVLNDLLFSSVGNAPPGVDTTPVPTKPGQSQRILAETRLANPACGGCHSRFEPLAFGLEKFDGTGAYHEVDEHGNKLRDDGELLFPGEEKPREFRSAGEFMGLLAGSERVRRNMTRKVTQFALGRPLREADGPIVDRIHAAAVRGGGTYQSLLAAIVMSDLVQMTQTER